LIRGQGIYKYTPVGVAPSEMVVPLDAGYQAPTCIIPFPNLPAPSSTILPFDNTGSLTTAIAVTNISAATKTFDMVYADENNVTIFTDHISMAAHAHFSFLDTDTSTAFGSALLANKKGVLRVGAGPTDISMIAFFYDTATGAFGTIFPSVK
jgi:hypothetical protein